MSSSFSRPSRRPLALLLFLILLPVLCACDSPEPDYFSYRKTDFTAQLQGNRNRTDFTCEVVCRNGELRSITYSAPAALSGLRLTCSGSACLVERDGIFAECPESLLPGLLAPGRLLLLRDASLLTVQKIPEGVLLTVSCPSAASDLSVTLGGDGFPLVISCDEITFRVTGLVAQE